MPPQSLPGTFVNVGGLYASGASLGGATAINFTNGAWALNGANNVGATYPITINAGGTYWTAFSSYSVASPITLNSGGTLQLDSGGGNADVYSGAIAGPGNLLLTGNTSLSLGPDATFSGSSPNTFSGSLVIDSGVLALDKSPGVIAVPGNIQIGNGTAEAELKIEQSGQLATTSAITLNDGTYAANGFSQNLGTLLLPGASNSSTLNLSGGSSATHFADSSALVWGSTASSQLIIYNWGGSSGSSATQVFVGSSSSALTATQLSEVGFMNPAGQAAGLYHATISASGQLLPSSSAVQAINPPFDVSPAAEAARAAVYTSNGTANLAGASSPLTAGEHISFFGDSITWLNGYVSNIQTALNGGVGTSGKNIICYNDGINGGGVLDVLNGNTTTAGFNGATPASLLQTCGSQGTKLAVVFIGVNDVDGNSITKLSSAAQFATALRSIVSQADSLGIKLVLATVAVNGELPEDGSNPYDTNGYFGANQGMDYFAQITRNVAATTDATLVDLRQVYFDYEQNNNAVLQLNGSLVSQSEGILTYDGIHPNATGNAMLANQIAQGLYVAGQPIATRTWNGSDGSSNWSATGNWSGAPCPTTTIRSCSPQAPREKPP